DVKLRIVSARHPGGAGAMLDLLALPGFRAGLAGQRHRPEAPDFFSRGLIEGCDEAADSFVAARSPGDYQVPDGKRSGCSVVVLTPVRHLGFPQQFAVGTVERD